VTGTDCHRVLFCQCHQLRVRAAGAHQTGSRRLAEGQAETDPRDGAHQCLVQILDRLDKVGLAKDDIGALRLGNGHKVEFHGTPL